MLRNTEALVNELTPLAQHDADGSLVACGVLPEQAVADLHDLLERVQQRYPQDADALKHRHGRYRHAPPPREGETSSIAYRVRLLFLDRGNLWPRLTRYRTWKGSHGETIAGTNNVCERPIGWNIKERYRSMRGYKRLQSAVNVRRLLCWGRNYRFSAGADLGTLIA